MSHYKIRPLTVSRDVLTACDPDCRFYPNLAGGVLADASCDARGTGFNNIVGGASFVEGGLQVVIDESATSFLQNGVSWTLPTALIVPGSSDTDITLEWLLVPVSYWDNPGVGVNPSIGVIHLGQSEYSSNYLLTGRLNPYTGMASFSLAFVGSSASVPFVLGQPVHFCIQRPANPSAGTPERYFINGVQVLSRDTRTTNDVPDTWTLGGFHSSAPAGGILTVLYKEARIATGFTYPHTAGGFTPPTRLRPPRLFTGLADPVVTLGAPVEVTEEEAEVYTAGRASPWVWQVKGTQEFPAAGDTEGAAATVAPEVLPDVVSWQVDFPPYPSSTLEPAVSVTFDETTWELTAQVATAFRNRAVVAGGEFVPRTFYSDLSVTYDTDTGAVALSAAATADCEDVEGWTSANLSKIGGYIMPQPAACPPRPPTAAVSTAFATAPPLPGVGDTSLPVQDFSVTHYVGRPSDRFTLTISSVGIYPLTLSGVDWTGWYFNNTRRI